MIGDTVLTSRNERVFIIQVMNNYGMAYYCLPGSRPKHTSDGIVFMKFTNTCRMMLTEVVTDWAKNINLP